MYVCISMLRLTACILSGFYRNGIIAQLIHAAGHRLVLRAPYYPVDGPIEYVFNTLQQGLTAALYRIGHDDPAVEYNRLRREVMNIIRSMVDFSNYFVHCGFRYN